MKESKKNLYRCESCKKFFPYENRKVKTRQLYNVTTNEDACPFCNSWNITAYGSNKYAFNKYMNHNVVNDGRYYAK